MSGPLLQVAVVAKTAGGKRAVIATRHAYLAIEAIDLT